MRRRLDQLRTLHSRPVDGRVGRPDRRARRGERGEQLGVVGAGPEHGQVGLLDRVDEPVDAVLDERLADRRAGRQEPVIAQDQGVVFAQIGR